MPQRFSGHSVVVTGSASGIGRAVARQFASEGAIVTVADVREAPREGGTATHELIQNEGGTAQFVETNVASQDDVQTATDEAIDAAGSLNVMVNNAGIFPEQQEIQQVKEDTYDEVMDVNLKGVYLGCQAAVDVMRDQNNGGVIVNTSSVAGLFGYEHSSVYCASKGGVTNLTRELAVEQGPHGIRVNAVNPGIIETSQTRLDEEGVLGEHIDEIPLRRDGMPDDVANAVLFLASEDAEYVTGHNLVVDGGLTSG